jgi:hypothetical protein
MRTKQSAFACFLALAWVSATYAVDGGKLATKVETFASWQVIQFALPTTSLYRLAATSVNYPAATITVDLSDACLPRRVVMNWNVGDHTSAFSGTPLVLAYKIPGEKDDLEFVMGERSADDTLAFFPFKKLTATRLFATQSKGNLAIWIPASGDGTVKRSSNMYFPLEGFTAAYNRAKKLCTDDR